MHLIKKWIKNVAEKVKSMVEIRSTAVGKPVIMIFERLFIKACDKEKKATCSDETNALLFMCTWSFSAQFYELFSKCLNTFHTFGSWLFDDIHG